MLRKKDSMEEARKPVTRLAEPGETPETTIAPAKAEDNARNSAASPEAQPTPKEARQAAQKLFDKADEDGKAEIIAENQARLSALGY